MLTLAYVESQQGASPIAAEAEGYLSAVYEGTGDAQLLHVPAPCFGHAQHNVVQALRVLNAHGH